MTPWTHHGAALLYLLAAVIGGRKAATRPASRSFEWLLCGGVALHAIAFVRFHRLDPPISLESTAAALSVIGWLVASTFLLSLRFAKTLAVGRFVAASAFGFTAAASIGLHLRSSVALPGPAGAWPHAHVLLAAAGFAALAVASLAGLGYLVKERLLKARRRAAPELPSLESLDRLGVFALSLGFPLLTLGVFSGFVWALGAGGSLWTRHVVMSLVAWGVYCVPVGARLLRGQGGPRLARSLVVGFAVLAVCYLGTRALELVS
ncbi:MAG: cytochrome c biogenesis protein CcsA [Myxococcota bacterium]